jgi:hypothetical protein
MAQEGVDGLANVAPMIPFSRLRRPEPKVPAISTLFAYYPCNTDVQRLGSGAWVNELG